MLLRRLHLRYEQTVFLSPSVARFLQLNDLLGFLAAQVKRHAVVARAIQPCVSLGRISHGALRFLAHFAPVHVKNR